jgi:hypothetical protein
LVHVGCSAGFSMLVHTLSVASQACTWLGQQHCKEEF